MKRVIAFSYLYIPHNMTMIAKTLLRATLLTLRHCQPCNSLQSSVHFSFCNQTLKQTLSATLAKSKKKRQLLSLNDREYFYLTSREIIDVVPLDAERISISLPVDTCSIIALSRRHCIRHCYRQSPRECSLMYQSSLICEGRGRSSLSGFPLVSLARNP